MSQADLFRALRAGDTSKCKEILEGDSALLNAKNENGVSVVLMACYMGRKEIRDLLIAKGAHLDLHEAAAAGHLPRVKELVEPNPSAAAAYSTDGFPVMALAAVFGHEEVARYLHSRGADVNAISRNGTGYTALTGAVASNHAAIAKWLVENGADVNYRYAKGHSPLLEAAANGNLEIAKILLAHGADPNVRTDDNKSALNFAEERGHTELAAFLRNVATSRAAHLG